MVIVSSGWKGRREGQRNGKKIREEFNFILFNVRSPQWNTESS